MAKHKIKVVELFAGVGGFPALDLKVHRMPMIPFGTINGNLRRCIKMHRWFIRLDLDAKDM